MDNTDRIVYGQGLTDGARAHYRSMAESLVELKILNLGDITDNGLRSLITRFPLLHTLHLEHPLAVGEELPRAYRSGTIATIIKDLPMLQNLTLGFEIAGLHQDQDLFKDLLRIKHLALIRCSSMRFDLSEWITEDCKWRSLTIIDCRDAGPDGLLSVLKRCQRLKFLEWRFPPGTYYDPTEYELKVATCRRLKYFILENASISDQCLMRLFRVCAELELVALSNCDEIHRIRPCASPHYHLKELSVFMQNIYKAFEECFLDMQTLVLTKQDFLDERKLATSVNCLFRDARALRLVELRACRVGYDESAVQTMIRLLDRKLRVEHGGMSYLTLALV